MMSQPVISLMTDFGPSFYVGQMKGVLAELVPSAIVIDLTHEIPPQAIAHGAIVLQDSLQHFPRGSIHIAVVDPGVGTDRDIVAVEIDSRWIIGPNNGLLSAIAEDIAPSQIIKVSAAEFMRSDASHTFHGRDVMAPVAAHLALGKSPEQLGGPLSSLAPSPVPVPVIGDSEIQAETLVADRFGNLLTNLRLRDLNGNTGWDLISDSVSCALHLSRKGVEIAVPFVKTYADTEPGQMIALFGSAGRLEISCNGGNAAAKLGTNVVPLSIYR